ncbi:hypothetical protein GCM10028808_74590 [Spirosoma migulaei]
MNELVKVDDSTYYDPKTGEEYFSIDYDWVLNPKQQKDSTCRQLGEIIESLVLMRTGTDWEAPELSLAEYIDRIASYKAARIKENGSYLEFCEMVAQEVTSSGKYYERESKYLFIAMDKVKVAYRDYLVQVADELIEYRALQQARKRVDRNALIKHLQELFITKSSNSAVIEFKSVTADLEAELSLLLTNEEREDNLKTEYKSRLIIYKKKAEGSAVANINFEFIPWQCFTTQYLNRTCSDFVYVYVDRHPTDIEFDLSLINSFSRNKIKVETSHLAAEWLIIEWIKGKISGNVSIPSLTNKNVEVSTKKVISKPREENPERERKARMAVVRFENLLSDAVIKERSKKNPMPDKEIVKTAIREYMQSKGLNLAATEKGLGRYLKCIGKQETPLQYGGQFVRQIKSRK